MSQEFAKVVWQAGDVQSIRPNWSDERAEQWLADNQRHIQDRLVELGWEVIEDLLGDEDEDDE